MAGHGPAPKDPENRARRNSDPAGRTTVVRDGEVRGLALPDGYGWHEMTRQWWEAWRRAPQAAAFEDTDWLFLLETAKLHSAFWEGDVKVAPELRLRVAKFGATVEDRARLRLDITAPAVDGEAAAEGTSRSRYSHLRSVGGSGAVAGA